MKTFTVVDHLSDGYRHMVAVLYSPEWEYVTDGLDGGILTWDHFREMAERYSHEEEFEIVEINFEEAPTHIQAELREQFAYVGQAAVENWQSQLA